MTQVYNKASERVLGGQTLVDVPAASPQLRRYPVVIPVPQATQNATTETVFALARAVKIVAIYLVYPGVVPACAGGTSTIKVEHIAADGSTAVSIVGATDILTGFTTQIPVALTLAATNPTTMAGGGSVMASVVTNNNAVGAAGVAGALTFLVEPIEDTTISF